MKLYWVGVAFLLLGLVGCSRHQDDMASRRIAGKRARHQVWEQDQPRKAFAIEEEFVGASGGKDHFSFTEEAIGQSRYIPGVEGSGIPSLDKFQDAIAGLGSIFQTLYFNTDDYILRRPEYSQIVDAIAVYLKKHPKTHIAVVGHCDERGSEAYNLSLGTKRANYVRSLLVERGIDPNRIHSSSYGKEQPADPGHTPAAWSRNRRAEFKIYERP